METVQAITLRQYLDQYRRSRLDLKDASAEQLSVAVNLLDNWQGSPVQLSALSTDLLSDWLHHLKQSGRSPRTINGRRASIITLWKHAAKKKLAPAFDPDDVPRIKTPRRLPTSWSVDDMRKMLPHIEDSWLKTFISFIYETGCRLSSATLLTWSDWDSERRIMTLPSETSKTGIEQRVKVSKTTADSIDLLKPLIAVKSSKIFPCQRDKRPMWRRLRKALKAAGLPHGRRDLFQKIRRTNATQAAVHGSPEIAQRQLGHTTLRQTLDAYIDPTFLVNVHAVDILPTL